MPTRDHNPPPAPDSRGFGRDGISGLVDVDRGLRAREVSQPDDDDRRAAREALPDLLARAQSRRR